MFWMGLFAVGTLQWFRLVPFFLRDAKMTMLNLSTVNSRSHTVQTATTAHAPHPSEPAMRRLEQPASHFDERGRTPLERVFDDSD
jgi:hypothetical protein